MLSLTSKLWLTDVLIRISSSAHMLFLLNLAPQTLQVNPPKASSGLLGDILFFGVTNNSMERIN